MEFKSLAEIVRFIDNALALKFYTGSGVLRKGVLKVLASVIGGAVYMLSLLARRIWKNRFVTTCDVSSLDGFGAEYGIPHKPAIFAYGNIKLALSGASSATLPADTYFVDPQSGLQYKTVAAATVSASGTQIVKVIAAEPGAESNLDVGAELQFRDTKPTGFADEVTVSADAENRGIDGGFSVEVEIDGLVQLWGETAEDYRQRLLNRIQNPPQGGSKNDYRQQAERFSFVSRAYVLPNNPYPNCVCVALANWNGESITVPAADVSQVSTYLNSDVRRNIAADIRVFSVTPVEFSINGSFLPYNDAVRESIMNCFNQLAKEMEPGTAKNIDQVEGYIKNNSSADSFVISSVSKGGQPVANIALDFNGTSNVAQVAKFTTTLKKGE